MKWPRFTRILKLARIAAWINLGLVVLFLFLIHAVSERWWLGTLVTYAPKWPALLPSVFLLPLCFFGGPKPFLTTLGAAGLVLTAGMGLNISLAGGGQGDSAAIRVVSCNVHKFKPDFEAVQREIREFKPDVVILQEAIGKKPGILKNAFPGWNWVATAEFWVGSRFPVELAECCQTSAFNRESAIAVRVKHPDGAFVVIDLHTWTARHGISQLSPKELAGKGLSESLNSFREHQAKRESEISEVATFAERFRRDGPLVVAGDFNMPVSSSFYRSHWSGFKNAFSRAGWGYGYTAPCDRTGFLPSGWPWVRIDHILVNDSWDVLDCRVGRSNGSDHRLIFSEIRLRRSDS